MAEKQCRKCAYTRLPIERVPDHICPRCGEAYVKSEAAQARKKERPEPSNHPKDAQQRPTEPPPGKAATKARNNRKLTTCRVCKEPISRRAKRCPHCGEDNPARRIRAKELAFIFVGIVVVAMLLTPESDTTSNAQASAATPEPEPRPVSDPTPAAAPEPRPISDPTRAEEPERLSDAECMRDLRCWGDRNSFGAILACEDKITARAKYAYEWTDGWLGVKLKRFNWHSKDAGILAYYGDELRVQNGFGAWLNVRYKCVYDPNSDSVLRVNVTAR